MINITVEVWPMLSEIFVGDKSRRCVFNTEVAENCTLEELIGTLCESKPALGRFFVKTEKNELCDTSGYVSVILNDHLINSMESYQRKLQDGDRVLLVQGFAGG